MIDTRIEKLLSLTQATKLKNLPRRRGRKRPHAATLYRWAKNGVAGIRLETLRVGGTLCTSAEALQRFFETLSRVSRCNLGRPTEADERLRRVSAELDEAGF